MLAGDAQVSGRCEAVGDDVDGGIVRSKDEDRNSGDGLSQHGS